ncbi:MAG: hypothetical protein EA363_00935 [Balneolaceae bacterium]|nr:MAG: hypothetical protein EA363_00935 [Balneolaceae bacterium]
MACAEAAGLRQILSGKFCESIVIFPQISKMDKLQVNTPLCGECLRIWRVGADFRSNQQFEGPH